jgi:rhamnose utilization protein RhaD (predicted bifunctional aldolase and dehydrogenase)/NAD(P)-dependent dehydrogenase (short-subunit alcohol dehydrogenase family)
MNNTWVESEANGYIRKYGQTCGSELALMVYATRLVGGEPDLAMHGGGNTSLKGTVTTVFGEKVDAIFVKASGVDMKEIDPSGFVCLDHAYLKKLRALSPERLTDEAMAEEFRTHMLRPGESLPSIETLMHAFMDKHFVVHTHPTSVLSLTNRENGEAAVKEALGSDVAVIPYANAGLALGRAVADKLDKHEGNRALVVMHHGLVTWGTHPKQAYDTTVEMVNRAEEYVRKSRRRVIVPGAASSVAEPEARKRYRWIAPVLRGLLSPRSDDPDHPHVSMVLLPVITEEVLHILGSAQAKELSCSAPLTPDYLVRTKAYSLLIENPDYRDPAALRKQCADAIGTFSADYDAYVKKYASRIPGLDATAHGFDLLPRVVLLPGIGAICAGPDVGKVRIAADITEQAIVVKRAVYETGGTYQGLTEDHLFDMEFRAFQRAKVGERAQDHPVCRKPLRGKVALVTGAAGAIGSGICGELLANGCAVVLTDLAGDHLDSFVAAMKAEHGDRAIGIALDVTESVSIAAAFEKTVGAFGGIDIVIVNAGLAHVSPLVDMDLAAFQKLERVNVEGTLMLLAEAGRHFRTQALGGDIVLVSTKNVFAPGAKFGAYSATKAGSHQLARIASLEFADMGVRVNMVSPDAVFSHGSTKSGLWAQVGPDRMKARGLDEKGLEDYYRQRNLLKAQVTARHVANAVMFFVTHQTPTTGATIPVDGGLPDATPR